jgi:hypothetical protein
MITKGRVTFNADVSSGRLEQQEVETLKQLCDRGMENKLPTKLVVVAIDTLPSLQRLPEAFTVKALASRASLPWWYEWKGKRERTGK